jgi:Domain of unknown function (DUF1816)
MMKSLSPQQSTLAWWVEVHTSFPPQTYQFGPFTSREEAMISRGAQVEALHHKETRDIVALIKQR